MISLLTGKLICGKIRTLGHSCLLGKCLPMVHEGGPGPEMPRDREDDFQVVRVPVHPPHLVQRSRAPRYKSSSTSVCSLQNEGSRVGTVPVSVNFGKNEFRHVLPLLKLDKKNLLVYS